MCVWECKMLWLLLKQTRHFPQNIQHSFLLCTQVHRGHRAQTAASRIALDWKPSRFASVSKRRDTEDVQPYNRMPPAVELRAHTVVHGLYRSHGRAGGGQGPGAIRSSVRCCGFSTERSRAQSAMNVLVQKL